MMDDLFCDTRKPAPKLFEKLVVHHNRSLCRALNFYVSPTIPNRSHLINLIKTHGGVISRYPGDTVLNTINLVDSKPTTPSPPTSSSAPASTPAQHQLDFTLVPAVSSHYVYQCIKTETLLNSKDFLIALPTLPDAYDDIRNQSSTNNLSCNQKLVRWKRGCASNKSLRQNLSKKTDQHNQQTSTEKDEISPNPHGKNRDVPKTKTTLPQVSTKQKNDGNEEQKTAASEKESTLNQASEERMVLRSVSKTIRKGTAEKRTKETLRKKYNTRSKGQKGTAQNHKQHESQEPDGGQQEEVSVAGEDEGRVGDDQAPNSSDAVIEENEAQESDNSVEKDKQPESNEQTADVNQKASNGNFDAATLSDRTVEQEKSVERSQPKRNQFVHATQNESIEEYHDPLETLKPLETAHILPKLEVKQENTFSSPKPIQTGGEGHLEDVEDVKMKMKNCKIGKSQRISSNTSADKNCKPAGNSGEGNTLLSMEQARTAEEIGPTESNEAQKKASQTTKGNQDIKTSTAAKQFNEGTPEADSQENRNVETVVRRICSQDEVEAESKKRIVKEKAEAKLKTKSSPQIVKISDVNLGVIVIDDDSDEDEVMKEAGKNEIERDNHRTGGERHSKSPKRRLKEMHAAPTGNGEVKSRQKRVRKNSKEKLPRQVRQRQLKRDRDWQSEPKRKGQKRLRFSKVEGGGGSDEEQVEEKRVRRRNGCRRELIYDNEEENDSMKEVAEGKVKRGRQRSMKKVEVKRKHIRSGEVKRRRKEQDIFTSSGEEKDADDDDDDEVVVEEVKVEVENDKEGNGVRKKRKRGGGRRDAAQRAKIKALGLISTLARRCGVSERDALIALRRANGNWRAAIQALQAKKSHK